MIATTTENAAGAAEGAAISENLQATRTAIDHVLQEIALRPAEARRFVTRDLEFEPRAAVLRAIGIIAREEADGRIWDGLPRELLALHVLLARELNELLDSPAPDATGLRRGGQRLPLLLLELRVVEADLSDAVARVAEPTARILLLEIVEALSPSEERIVAAAVLAPRLALLVAGAGTDGSAAEFRAGVASHRDGTGGCRAIINAVALRTLIEEDLARLAELDADAERDTSGHARVAIVDRLRAERIAYGVVAARLCEHQEAAIDAGLTAFAETIGREKAELFTAQMRLAPVFRRGAAR